MHVSRGGGGLQGRGKRGPKQRDFGPGKPGIDPKATQNSPVLTQIGPGLARKSPGSTRGWLGGAWGGIFWCREVVLWGMVRRGGGNFWAVEFLLHAAGLFHLRRFFRFPPPAPSRCYSMCRRGPCRNGRGRSFNTSHFKGGCCPLCIPHGGEVSPAGSVGVGKAPLALNASPAPPPTRRCHAGGVTEGVSFQKIPSPLPPPTHALFRRRGARWRGRGKLFYTSHFKGGDSRQWRPSIADRGGSRDPPL